MPRAMFSDSLLEFGQANKRHALATTTSFVLNCLAGEAGDVFQVPRTAYAVLRMTSSLESELTPPTDLPALPRIPQTHTGYA